MLIENWEIKVYWIWSSQCHAQFPLVSLVGLLALFRSCFEALSLSLQLAATSPCPDAPLTSGGFAPVFSTENLRVVQALAQLKEAQRVVVTRSQQVNLGFFCSLVYGGFKMKSRRNSQWMLVSTLENDHFAK